MWPRTNESCDGSLGDPLRAQTIAMFTPESLGLGGVDYLQLFFGPDRDARQRDERVTKDLKHLTLKHEIVFLVLSSLSRGDSDRDD
jgi:replicative DNA helicase